MIMPTDCFTAQAKTQAKISYPICNELGQTTPHNNKALVLVTPPWPSWSFAPSPVLFFNVIEKNFGRAVAPLVLRLYPSPSQRSPRERGAGRGVEHPLGGIISSNHPHTPRSHSILLYVPEQGALPPLRKVGHGPTCPPCDGGHSRERRQFLLDRSARRRRPKALVLSCFFSCTPMHMTITTTITTIGLSHSFSASP